MPVYQPDHVEYAIISGHIHIATDDGQQIPAFWSHPDVGGLFPGIVLMHDWWGITEVERQLSNRFAQAGYYVIVPDLFDGERAATAQDAMRLVEALGASGYPRVDAALQALENHHRCNRRVAAVGLGMGGTLAYQAAIVRDDLEAAIVYYGFPQRSFGRFQDAKAPILAIYGSEEPHVDIESRERLRHELENAALPHRVLTLHGAARDFFAPGRMPDATPYGQAAWRETLDFLDRHLGHVAPPANSTM